MSKKQSTKKRKTLVIDVGGTNLKVALAGQKEATKIPSGPEMTAAKMAAAVKSLAAAWKYDSVSIGFPGPVKDGKPVREPHNLAGGWVRFDYEKAFGVPVKIVNDAAMQALGGYEGGRLLFLGLGTGLGSALVVEGVLAPLELAHLPYRKGKTYEEYVGIKAYKKMGARKWTDHVHKVVELLSHGLQADTVVLGGGQTKKLKSLPPGVKVGENINALYGGLRLWEELPKSHQRRAPTVKSKKLR